LRYDPARIQRIQFDQIVAMQLILYDKNTIVHQVKSDGIEQLFYLDLLRMIQGNRLLEIRPVEKDMIVFTFRKKEKAYEGQAGDCR
jgi:hypothetical protein